MMHYATTVCMPLLGCCSRGEVRACVSVGLAATPPPINRLFIMLYAARDVFSRGCAIVSRQRGMKALLATPMRKEHWFATKKTLVFPRSAACSLQGLSPPRSFFSAENFLGRTQTAQAYTDWQVATPLLLWLKTLGIADSIVPL